jgi:hypothetical protein
MKLMESLFTDINDINYGCEKGKIDDEEFNRCINSLLTNTLDELELIKNNPYLEYTEDSIGDELYELKEWILEDWLNDHDTSDEQYIKYCQLNDALMIINEKGK